MTIAQLICSDNSSFIPDITKNTTIFDALNPCLVYSFIQLPLPILALLALLDIILLRSKNGSLGYKNGITKFKLVLITISYLLCLRYGHITSALIHFACILRSICSTLLTLHLFDGVFHNSNRNFILISLAYVSFVELVCSIALSIILWFPDTFQTGYERLNEKPQNPNKFCSTGQLMGFSYVFDFLRKCRMQTITYNDYWELENIDKVQHIREKLPKKYPSTCMGLMCLLFKCSWVNFMISFIQGCFVLALRFISCFWIIVILHLANGNYPLWLTLLAGLAPVAIDTIRIIYRQKYFVNCQMSYCNIYSALSSMIFDKMLGLSSSIQTNTSTGIIMNHVTVDLARIRVFWAYMKEFILCPATIILTMTFLSQIVGLRGTFYGTSVLFGFMFANIFMSKYSTRFYLLNDILSGIKVLKLYGWEDPIQRMITEIREKEIKEMKKSIFFSSFIDGSLSFAPFVAIIMTFYGLVVDGRQMSPEAAFVTLALYSTVCGAINFLPQLFISAATAVVSLRRLLKFLNQEERLSEKNVFPLSDGNGVAVSFENASFSWSNNADNLYLKEIDLKIQKGQLVAIIGSVGAGKSTFLQALVGELQPLNGQVKLYTDKLAYVTQTAWIQNLSLRDNILFDSEMDTTRYQQVISACSLLPDIELLKSGDLTEIGDKGINLSGGQKARVSLARAVYHQADLYAIDDPFSAVDSHVSEQLFNEVVGPNGLLNKTTRVVALNSTKFLPYFDLIVCLNEGKITHFGTFDKLSTDETSPISSNMATSSPSNFETSPTETSLVLNKTEKADKLVQDENLSYGRVSSNSYVYYFRAYDFWNIAIVLPILFLLTTSMYSMSNVYLAKWSSSSSSSFTDLEIYGALGIGGSTTLFIAFVLLYFGAYGASRVFHRNMIESVIRARMAFFDQTPIGRIMNRFTTDIESVDSTFAQLFAGTILGLEAIAYSLISIFIAIPFLIPVVLPLGAIGLFIARFFNAATAQFRRMRTGATSKFCSDIQDLCNGASSIRCYGSIERFRHQLSKCLDCITECNFVEQNVSAWIRTVLCILSNTAMLVFIIVGVLMANEGMISMGLLALIVNSSFTLSTSFGSIAELYRNWETEIVAMERINEYSHLKSEDIWTDKQVSLREAPNGKIEFRRVSLKYREHDDPVLHGVSFCVESGQKVGIVGRTGAGKTSLTSLLFRLVEPFEGTILIGDVDTKRYGVHLRRILTIIPQDPFLFCGSLKANLDPFNEYTVEEIWNALDKANLSDFVRNLTNGLDYEITDGGSNLSVGQRQLICLARALLRTTSILVLDEATASVDNFTDSLIQKTIRENFSNCTILTIAHRLETIMDSDKILVIEAGHLQEFDSPSNLLADTGSLFYGFAKRAGII